MSYAQSTLATFDQMLGTLEQLVGKIEQSGKPGLLEARLASDMFPLATQVRFTLTQVVNTLNRLAGAEIALGEDDPGSFVEAKATVAKVREAVQATSADAFLAPEASVEFDLPNGMAFALTAEEYVRDWSMAQFYFHLMAFYAIARAQGVELGKADYVPYMLRHLKQPATA